jgi:release factor glutamine methyltransferase
VADALRDGARALRAAGIPDPARDARRLMAHCLDLDPARLTLLAPEPLTADAAGAFAAAIARRVGREPMSHITGWRDFYGRRFVVTEAVLDPRPETESVVEAALARPFARVLDLGTGSGCILLTLLAERPAARGTGTDISEAALGIARANAVRLGSADRVDWIATDWLEGLTGRYDLIVSNPPYIGEAELAQLAPELSHEPAGALSPGADALAAYRRIAAGAGARLEKGGVLCLEIGATQGSAVYHLLAAAGFAEIAVLPDLDGRDRVVRARLRPESG